jgi:eukaryotic-like serine/threonine-protein kinase
MDITPGAVVAGRYRAERRIGSGGMGEVWIADHAAVGLKVALKTLLPAASVDHEVVARFKREAYLLGKIRSDHVARVLDFVSDDTHGLVLVMEYVEGQSLASILQHQRLTIDETIELGVDVLSALVDLHRAHVVHRDLKPGNILMRPLPDGRQRAVVVDFGVSRLVSAGSEEDSITGITKADMALGTLEYMAPEQILNSRDVTAVSDLYAVGALLYRAVAGKHVYGSATDSELAHKKLLEDPPALSTGRSDAVGRGLEAVVNRALKRRPANRYATAAEMLTDLSAVRDAARVMTLDLDATTTETFPMPGSIPGAPDTQVSASPIEPKRAKQQEARTVPDPGSAEKAKQKQAAEAAKSPPSPPKEVAIALPTATVNAELHRRLDESDSTVARAQDELPPARSTMSSAVPISEQPLPRGRARGGVPVWMFGSGLIVTLVLGAVLGKLYTEHRVQAGARSATAESTAAIGAAPAGTPEPAPPGVAPAGTGAAVAEVSPEQDVKTMRAESAVDLGEIDPAQPARPRPLPTAPLAMGTSSAQPLSTSKPASTASSSAGTGQETPKPSATPTTAPTSTPTSTAAQQPKPTSKPSAKPSAKAPPPKSPGDDPFE